MNPNEKILQEEPAVSAPGEGSLPSLMEVQERLGLFAGPPAEEHMQAALEQKPLALV